jgi:4-amino-4-deoxy-L-arabinose transferase-like glycosyltransferase
MSVITRLLAPAERLTVALCDPVRRERAMLAVLVSFAAIWTLYGVLAKGSQGVHFDMAELADQSRHLAFGYAKNPPFAMWATAAWFTVFPRADWAFYLLAMTGIAAGLWAAWQLFGRHLDAEKRVLALALLTLVPLLTFHALKFNNNALMFPLWALATLFFVRSYEERSIGAATLAGLFAAAAMLTKYWSVFLIAGFALAALAGRHRAAYFRSPAPWISAVVGALALAPHVWWLYQHNFSSFGYALLVHGGFGFAVALKSVLGYLAGAAGYVAFPVVVMAIALRPSRAALADMLRTADAERRFVAWLFWTTLLAPIAVALITGSQIVALWTIGCWTLLPVLLLSPPSLGVTRAAAVRVVALAIAVPAAATLAAPAIAYAIHRAGSANLGAYFKPLAAVVEREWRQATARPLRIVAGQGDLAYGVAFYSRDGAMAFPDFSRRLAPWIDNAALVRDGVALVCPAENAGCVDRIKGYAGNAPRFHLAEVTLTPRYLGLAGAARRFTIVVVPPQNALARDQQKWAPVLRPIARQL